MLVCFIAPLIEWTGFIAAAGFALALFYFADNFKSKYLLLLGVGCSVAAALALMTFVAHSVSVIGFSESLNYMLSRWRSMSGVRTDNLLGKYLLGILQSFGAFPIAAILGIYAIKRKMPKAFIALCFVAGFPILENFIVMQHATLYFFDRTKIIVIIMLVLTAWTIVSRSRKVVVVIWLLALTTNIAMIFVVPKTIDVSNVTAGEKSLWKNLGRYNLPCTVITASSGIRGYYATMTNRGIYENTKTIEVMKGITKERKACAYSHPS